MLTSYFTLVREMRSAYNHHLRLVSHAREHSMKPTARLFQTTQPTVRKRLRRIGGKDPKERLDADNSSDMFDLKPLASIVGKELVLAIAVEGIQHLLRPAPTRFGRQLEHRTVELPLRFSTSSEFRAAWRWCCMFSKLYSHRLHPTLTRKSLIQR